MPDAMIPAEVEPRPSQAHQAALALQRLGFRVLHIGPTISVQGPQALWESTFHVSFEQRRKTVLREVEGGEVTYPHARTETLGIPPELQHLIAAVLFVEPPELFAP
jgi:hypothetical protein